MPFEKKTFLRLQCFLPSDPKGSRFSYTTWIRCGTGDSTHLRWVHPIDNPPSIINSLICTWGKRNDVGTGPGWRGIFGKLLTPSQSSTSLKRTWSTCKNGAWKMILLLWDSVRFQGRAVIVICLRLGFCWHVSHPTRRWYSSHWGPVPANQ